MTAKLKRICLIEDDEVMGEALVDRLTLEGFDCHWCKTGAEAKKALASQHFAVAICDIQLPDVNGEQLFAELAQNNIAHPPSGCSSWVRVTT
jgi:DNA-binding response OmpR family regulator